VLEHPLTNFVMSVLELVSLAIKPRGAHVSQTLHM
jgi:hypothetical protein